MGNLDRIGKMTLKKPVDEQSYAPPQQFGGGTFETREFQNRRGGILPLNNFNHETAPGEAAAVRELLPDLAIRTFPFAQQPTAYIQKPTKG